MAINPCEVDFDHPIFGGRMGRAHPTKAQGLALETGEMGDQGGRQEEFAVEAGKFLTPGPRTVR
jgi:hypothetical protein